jgi:hypothetical protein
MKSILLFTVIAIFNAVMASAQIQKTDLPEMAKIAEVKSAGTFIADLRYYLSGSDTMYVITFNNLKYTTLTDIKSISFSGKDGTLQELYKILIETLDSEPGFEKPFKLGDDEVLVKSNRMLGVKYISFWIVKNAAYFQLNKKQINKLFNKS